MITRRASTVSALEDHVGFWLRLVSNHVSGRFRQALEARGVSVTEWVVLRTLMSPAGATHAELIDVLGMTKGATSKVITRLEEQGLARRQGEPDGGRGQKVVLTARGTRLVPELAKLADENDSHFFGHLEPSKRDALLAVLQEVVRIHQLKQVPVS